MFKRFVLSFHAFCRSRTKQRRFGPHIVRTCAFVICRIVQKVMSTVHSAATKRFGALGKNLFCLVATNHIRKMALFEGAIFEQERK